MNKQINRGNLVLKLARDLSQSGRDATTFAKGPRYTDGVVVEAQAIARFCGILDQVLIIVQNLDEQDYQ